LTACTIIEGWHFPLLNTYDGISLERIRFSDATQQAVTGTVRRNQQVLPRRDTAIHSLYADDNDGSEVSIVPEVFSPMTMALTM
jgi:hypothetical protein